MTVAVRSELCLAMLGSRMVWAPFFRLLRRGFGVICGVCAARSIARVLRCFSLGCRLRLDFYWPLDLGWPLPSTSLSTLLQGFNTSSAKGEALPSLTRKVRQGCLCMGTPASDPDSVTQLSLDFEGLRISITRGRVPSAASAPASSEAPARASAPPLTPRVPLLPPFRLLGVIDRLS